uniref:Uncharacterized protein n=1 Tax=Strongyloides stercoralis TaxID=6248 RepID=A0AAF5PFQ1_STRER
MNNEIFAKLENINKDVLLNKASMKIIKKNPCLEEINKENLQKDLLAENEIGFYSVDGEICYSNGFVINVK